MPPTAPDSRKNPYRFAGSPTSLITNSTTPAVAALAHRPMNVWKNHRVRNILLAMMKR